LWLRRHATIWIWSSGGRPLRGFPAVSSNRPNWLISLELYTLARGFVAVAPLALA